MSVRLNWVNAPGNLYDMAFFRIQLAGFNARIAGSDDQFRRPGLRQPYTIESTLGTLPVLRCDRGLAQVNTSGCVFPQAAPVYVLKTQDVAVSEAAEHVREAQANGSPGKWQIKERTRAFSSGGPALQRFKNADNYGDPNRKAACKKDNPNALINVRPPRSSNTCSPSAPKCECDEYPFNSSWQGAAYEPQTTSVKWINAKQNQNAGVGNLSGWYKTERVLDLAEYPLDGATLPSGGGSSDFFWVYVPLAD